MTAALSLPLELDDDWAADALCRTEGHPTWWDDVVDTGDDRRPEPRKERDARHEKAKAICRRCPVITDCMRTAVIGRDTGIRFGELMPDTLRSAGRQRRVRNFHIRVDQRRSA